MLAEDLVWAGVTEGAAEPANDAMVVFSDFVIFNQGLERVDAPAIGDTFLSRQTVDLDARYYLRLATDLGYRSNPALLNDAAEVGRLLHSYTRALLSPPSLS